MDVLKKLRNLGKSDASREADLKKRRDLYEFSTIAQHGFPNKPTALTYDPVLNLIAVGSQSGSLRIFGKPGVQFCAEFDKESHVDKLSFLPNEGRLVALCKDNTISLWELNAKKEGITVLEQVKSFNLNVDDSQNLVISCWDLSENCEEILLGTEQGNVLVFNVKEFKLTDRVFKRENISQKTLEDIKGSVGSVESIKQLPNTMDQFLIGYKSGLVIQWCSNEDGTKQVFNTGTSLEALSFRSGGEEFLVGHSDGSCTTWRLDDPTKASDITTTYGPYPCRPVTKIESKKAAGGEVFVFSGGIPRSYNDRHTASVIHGGKHVTFDFSSRVIDFFVTSTQESGDADTLIVLVEEELIAIDLLSEGWPQFCLPYLNSIHYSPVTSVLLLHDIPAETWNKISAGRNAQFENCSKRIWPFSGGSLNAESEQRHLLLTGHEDGSVSFWNASFAPGNFHLLMTVRTSELFSEVTSSVQSTNAEGSLTAPTGNDEDWPPFRKIGRFDPFTEDRRLSIQKLEFCPRSETLLVAGAAGQIIALSLQAVGSRPASLTVDIISRDSPQYKWTGNEALKQREDIDNKVFGNNENGFRPLCIAQLYPPDLCTAVALQTDWKLFAVGTAHGYALIDYAQNLVVCVKCTLAPAGMSPRVTVTRSRSLQKALRESFRKLRIKPPVSRSFDVVQHAGDEGLDKQRSKSDGGEPVTATEMKTVPEEALVTGDNNIEGKIENREQVIEEDKEVKTGSEQGIKSEETLPNSSEVDKQESTEESAEKKPAESIISESKEEHKVTDTNSQSEMKEDKADDTTTSAHNEENVVASETIETAHQDSAKESSAATAELAPLELLDIASTVNCLYLTKTFLLQGQPLTPTLWVGNSLGHITAYRIIMPSVDKRSEEKVQCILAKEVHLQHGAAMVSLKIVDRDNKPVAVDESADSAAVANETTTAAAAAGNATAAGSATAGHRLIVCSQEQIKIFSLPSLKAQHKVKVASRHSLAKIHNFSLAQFLSKSDSNQNEKHEASTVVCLTGDGIVHIYSIPHLRKQYEIAVTNPDDQLTTNSCVFSSHGFGFFLRSTSEMTSFTLAARHALTSGSVELPEGMRPEKPQEPEAKPVEVNQAEVNCEEQEKKTEVASNEAEKLENGNTGEGLNESITSAAGDITTDSVQVHLVEDDSTGDKTAAPETTNVSNGKITMEESTNSSEMVKPNVIKESQEVVDLSVAETSKAEDDKNDEAKNEVEHISTDIEQLKLEAQKEFIKTEEALGVANKEISESVEGK